MSRPAETWRPAHAERVARAVRWGARRLGCPVPGLRWFSSWRGEPVWGLFFPGSAEIWVRAGLPEHDATRTALHELKHYCDFLSQTEVAGRRLWQLLRDSDLTEESACAWAYRAHCELTGRW
jgi:hypothetical protein